MTVKELIKQLEEFDQELEVIVETGLFCKDINVCSAYSAVVNGATYVIIVPARDLCFDGDSFD